MAVKQLLGNQEVWGSNPTAAAEVETKIGHQEASSISVPKRAEEACGRPAIIKTEHAGIKFLKQQIQGDDDA